MAERAFIIREDDETDAEGYLLLEIEEGLFGDGSDVWCLDRELCTGTLITDIDTRPDLTERANTIRAKIEAWNSGEV